MLSSRSAKICYFFILTIAFFLFTIITFLLISFLFMKDKETSIVCIKNNCFEVEIVKSISDKKKGLSFRDNLEQNAGMLFVYEKEGLYSFWMKDMNFPLDIIWINKDKKVVYMKESTQPCTADNCTSLKPKEKAIYILEVNSGLINKYNIKIGDNLVF